MDESSRFICPKCRVEHFSNLTAPRIFRRFLILSGRRGGKTLVGAHAAREEIMIPGSLGWVMGPTFKILHDSTFPTLVRLLPPQWIKNWDAENMEIDFTNGAKIAFRSLEDPERARGPGPDWGWFDEAALVQPRAWDVFRPSLSEKAGIAIFTTTVAGYDWTYDRFEIPALITKRPGFWACRYKTIDNPLFRLNPILREEIEEARQTMPPDLFAQEYEAERRNFTGAIYGEMVEKQTLHDDDEIRKLIPEWRGSVASIDPSRPVIIGLDSGSDHPFGAIFMVITDRGIVVIAEYLQRMQAISQQLPVIQGTFQTYRYPEIKWAANRNEANLRLEFGLRGIGVIPAENKHEIGIQRVQSWLYAEQLWIAYTCPQTRAQMRAYRYAENIAADGSKKKEQVYKLNDELPDAIRYGIMAWPALPKVLDQLDERTVNRLASFDSKTKAELEVMAAFNKAQANKNQDLQPVDDGYPMGDFLGGEDKKDGSGGWGGDFFL